MPHVYSSTLRRPMRINWASQEILDQRQQFDLLLNMAQSILESTLPRRLLTVQLSPDNALKSRTWTRRCLARTAKSCSVSAGDQFFSSAMRCSTLTTVWCWKGKTVSYMSWRYYAFLVFTSESGKFFFMFIMQFVAPLEKTLCKHKFGKQKEKKKRRMSRNLRSIYSKIGCDSFAMSTDCLPASLLGCLPCPLALREKL